MVADRDSIINCRAINDWFYRRRWLEERDH